LGYTQEGKGKPPTHLSQVLCCSSDR